MSEATFSLGGSGQKLSRRELLNYAWLTSLGVLLANMGGISFLFAMPRFRAGEFGGVFTLGRVSELPTVGAPPVNYPKGKFWLIRTEKGLVALYKVCTHLGCLYGWNDQERKFICPCHGSQFTYEGAYIRGPAPRSLDRFVIQLTTPEGRVLAETDPEKGTPLALPENVDVIVKVDTGRKIFGRPHA